MNTYLTKADVQYLSDKQHELDNFIMNNLDIKYTDWLHNYDTKHDIALRVELAEFVNECFDVWKYWKRKPIDRNRLLDEAIDVIHFCFLKLNKNNTPTDELHESITEWTETAERFIRDTVIDKHLHLLLSELYHEQYILGFILVILDRYGFTTKDIIEQYNIKNKVNFNRQENGY